MKIDPTSLSNATQGNYYYYYNSAEGDNYQSYGMVVYLEGGGGQGDGGYYANGFEIGPDPAYCMSKYTGNNARWLWSAAQTRCIGGN